MIESKFAALKLNTIKFMGCLVAACSYTETLEWMSAAIKRCSPTYVVTLNAQYLWQMHNDSAFREYVLSAGLIVPEYAVVWGARRLGISALQHIGGIVLLRNFLKMSSERKFRIYLLGARKEVVNSLAKQLIRQFGVDLVAGWHNGFLTPAEELNVVKEIQQIKPDAVFVAMGLPKQEQWIQKYGQSLCIPLCMGVGGSFDVLAGFKPDTPSWARGKGIEWLYRIYLDPRAYLRRYIIVNTWFVLQVYREKVRRLFRKVLLGPTVALARIIFKNRTW